ncbi:succinylglutamate desuccinylase/aspartoacylase family protein [Rhodanobacter ginsengisoli]|uniref:Succinylglutamate desuccinylase/aspartoacylase family protein n=1 Tax=Rhodanobacter ginsengisoli TaxID=418646 RepID=A0ABW0QS48_9GAMM
MSRGAKQGATGAAAGAGRKRARVAFEIGDRSIPAGTRRTVELPVSLLANHVPVNLPVHVIHGARPGPVIFLSAAVHGDEIIGVEIIRRVLRSPSLNRLAGTLLAIPIVNVYGFLNQSRYLPDRRDLNRCFPGSERGSLAAQLANLFLNEVVRRCEFGIDLHSAALHRMNLPQIRASRSRSEHLSALARAFGAPITLSAPPREGSLRAAAEAIGVETLIYEAGEALRFDELPVRAGVRGILGVLQYLHMLPSRPVSGKRRLPLEALESHWVRAPRGGLFRAFKTIGVAVEKGDLLGIVSDPFGDVDVEVLASTKGLVIGRSNLPIVNKGDALLHVAHLRDPGGAEEHVGEVHDSLGSDPLLDEDENP